MYTNGFVKCYSKITVWINLFFKTGTKGNFTIYSDGRKLTSWNLKESGVKYDI